MDRAGALPDRCVACNQPAANRVVRTMYWSPGLWRNLSVVLPLGMLFGGPALGLPILAVLFWPTVLILAIVHFIVRKKLKVDMAVCDRHRRLRNVLRALSVAAMLGMVLIFANWSLDDSTLYSLIGAVIALIVLSIVQSMIGVQAVALRRLDAEHAWLGGTGKPFREALPELPGG